MNPRRFFTATVISLLLSFGLLFSLNAAYAYPAGSGGAPASSSGVTIGSSFQTLIAPFENFFQNLANSIGSQSVLGGGSATTPPRLPTFNFNNIQNVNLQTLVQEIDQWFSNLNLMKVVTVVLNAILWVLWITQQFVQWLLGLVH